MEESEKEKPLPKKTDETNERCIRTLDSMCSPLMILTMLGILLYLHITTRDD